tara:strand:+ start:584 stop:1612 length:1029 start_codon:yes stop_codon:yes gene_type:complete
MKNKLNFLIIGTGSMGKVYANLVKNNFLCSLIAVVGNSKKKTKDFAHDFKIKGYDKGKMQQAIDENSEINCVIICTPEWVRLEPFEIAINNKLNILYEKPLASNYVEALQIFGLIKEKCSKKIVMPVQNLRFIPQLYSMKEKIENNEIGKIRHIVSRRNGNNSLIKRIINNISPFFWLSPHEIDLMIWMSGSSVEYVESIEANYSQNDGYILSNLKMKNNIDINHMSSWCTPPLNNYAPSSTFEIFGTGGLLVYNENNTTGIHFKNNEIIELTDINYLPRIQGMIVGPFKLLFEHFIHCIINNLQPVISPRQSLEVIKVCEAMKISSETGNRIYCNDIKKKL